MAGPSPSGGWAVHCKSHKGGQSVRPRANLFGPKTKSQKGGSLAATRACGTILLALLVCLVHSCVATWTVPKSVQPRRSNRSICDVMARCCSQSAELGSGICHPKKEHCLSGLPCPIYLSTVCAQYHSYPASMDPVWLARLVHCFCRQFVHNLTVTQHP